MVYSSRPIHSPRARPREIIMPVPLGDPLFTPNVGRGSDALPDTASRENHYSHPTALNRQRTTSNTTVPGIDVVTPVSLNLFTLALRNIHSRGRPILPVQTYLNELSSILFFLRQRVRTEPRFQNTPRTSL